MEQQPRDDAKRAAVSAGTRDPVGAAAPVTPAARATGARKSPPAEVGIERPAVTSPPARATDRPLLAPRRFEVRPGSPSPVDSTQTVRALTQLEQADDQSPKTFAIQLATSGEAIRSEDVPNLAIFDEYRLYSAAGLAQGRVVHALRLGFFSDEVAAAAVAGYLGSFFETATVIRVSNAERARFAERRIKGRKDSGDTGKHTRVELSSPPEAPATSLAELSSRVSVTSNTAGLIPKFVRRRNPPRQ
jgi:hypothetical protein